MTEARTSGLSLPQTVTDINRNSVIYLDTSDPGFTAHGSARTKFIGSESRVALVKLMDSHQLSSPIRDRDMVN